MSEMWTYSGADGSMPPRSGTAPKTVRAGRMRGCGFNMRPAEVERHVPKKPIKIGEKIPAFATLALKVVGLVPTFADGTQDVPKNEAAKKRHTWSQPTKEATDIYNSLAQDRARELELQIEARRSLPLPTLNPETFPRLSHVNRLLQQPYATTIMRTTTTTTTIFRHGF